MKNSITDKEIQILFKAFETARDFYINEIESRRDYLKWFTSLTGVGIVAAGYFIKKNSIPLTLSVLLALNLLGFAALRVCIGSSISALEAFCRFNRIQRFWLENYPNLRSCMSLHMLGLYKKKELSSFPIMALKLPYVVTIFSLINSTVTSSLAAISLWILGFHRIGHIAIFTIFTMILIFFMQRFYAVKSYMTVRDLVMEANWINVQEVSYEEKVGNCSKKYEEKAQKSEQKKA